MEEEVQATTLLRSGKVVEKPDMMTKPEAPPTPVVDVTGEEVDEIIETPSSNT